ncbi:low molecular weight protein-tyrosine-phosphatase [Fictibacillus sp. FJAT-27399]|uniref:low molecular weight protein-tyrosine-phosphatase n=1 Tax=Fictibacillus sp. FJAT-27399 TaxID=1729689 RepID=UPI000780350C|nr:low molecular weight protein-tyrosine-phosphatase [Fictibacillus sp. FJAT-27399]
MVKVLFVCLGNICRSPMAEAIFKDMVQKKGLDDKISVDSAGTGNWHVGEPPHEGTRDLLTKKNISFDGLKARQVVAGDLTEYDFVIGMDAKNIGDLQQLAGHVPANHVARLMDYVPESKAEDVPDPYFTGNFDEVYELVTEGCHHLLEDIAVRENL